MNKIFRLVLFFGLFLIVNSMSVTAITTDNLLNYYSFDNDVGSIVVDDFGNINGTMIGATNLSESSCKLGTCYDFDGVNDWIDIDNLDPSTSFFSFSFWVKADDNGLTHEVLVDIGSTSRVIGYWREYSNNTALGVYVDGTRKSFGATPTDGAWHHVVFIFSGTTAKAYVDGVQSGSSQTIPGITINSGSAGGFGASNAGGTPFPGIIDEIAFYDFALTESNITDLYNGGDGYNPISQPTMISNESFESTIFGESLGAVIINSTSFVNVLSANFEITTNNTPGYMTNVLNILSGTANTATCRILINGTGVNTEGNSTTTRTNEAGIIGSMYVTNDGNSYPVGNYTASFQCKVDAGNYIIGNVVGIGHFQVSENGQFVNKKHVDISATTSSSSFTSIATYNFTINDTEEQDGSVQSIVLEWDGSYANNAGSNETLDLYIDISGEACSVMPRNVRSGSVGSVSGDCLVENVTPGATYNMTVYAKGSNAEFNLSIHNKNFYLHIDEMNSIGLNGLNITSNSLQNLTSFPISNLHHPSGSLFLKAVIPFNSTTDSIGSFRLHVRDSTIMFTSPTFYRSVNNENGVLTIAYVVPDLIQDNYTVYLQGACNVGSCAINGGEMIAYLTGGVVTSFNAFNVTVNDSYTGEALQSFNVTISSGQTFTTTVGSLLVFSEEETENLIITAYDNGFYIPGIVISHPTNISLGLNLNQSIVDWDCYEKVTNNNLVCAEPSESDLFNYNVGSNPITQNINVSGYYGQDIVFNISALQTGTLNATGFYSTNLSLSASSPISTIDYCEYTATNGVFSETVNGYTNSWIGLINGTYNITVDCDGFELKTQEINIINPTQSLSFVLYTTNSFNITFRDETTNNVINTQTINIEFISSDESRTNTTNNGYLYVDLLIPIEYTFRYWGDDYQERFHHIKITNRTFNNLTLYLLNNSENISVTVYDQFNDYVDDAYIKVLKYDINKNTYVLREIVKTNFNGQTSFLATIKDEYYKFIIEKPLGNMIEETSPAYLLSNTLILKVQIGEEVSVNFENFNNIVYSLVFNDATNNFRLTYSDSENSVSNVCLKVYKVDNIKGNVLYDTSCDISSSGVLLINIPAVNGTTYIAKAYVTIQGEENFLTSLSKSYEEVNPIKNSNMGIFAGLLIILVFGLMSIWNIAVFVISVPLGLIFSIVFGFINIPLWVGIGLEMIALVLVVLISKRS